MTLEERHLRVEGVLDNVALICDFVVEQARAAGLDERAIHHCYLAVDEACTNIVEHGYGPACDFCIIEVHCHRDDNALTITIIDDSPAFDPLMRPDPDPAAPLSERGEGGWGIFFIKKLMDSVTYTYEDRHNRLVMVKKLSKAPPPREGIAPKPITVAALPGSAWQLTPEGRLDETQADLLASALGGQLAAGHRWLVINMAEVDFISSAGLKVLVSAWQRVRDHKGELVLAEVKPRVGEVLEMIGLDLVFTIIPTAEQARDYLLAKVK